MRYFSEEEIIAQGWANAAQLQRLSGKATSIITCKDCRFKESENCPLCRLEIDEDFYCKKGNE